MVSLVSGIVAGVGSAVIMGIVSEGGYRFGIFKSSLLVIDGSFFLKSMGKGPEEGRYVAGILIHLFTGALFGGIYVAGTSLFGINPLLPGLVAIYFLLLWLSMLLIALPVAGQGIMGRKASPGTWLEQLVLHVIFGLCYYYFLVALA